MSSLKAKVAGVTTLAVLMTAGVMLGPVVTGLMAHEGKLQAVDCQGVTFAFSAFNPGTNTVRIQVFVDGTVRHDQPFTFTGTSATRRVGLNLSGDHVVRGLATWDTNGHKGSFDTGGVRIVCTTQTVATPGGTETVVQTVASPPVTVTTTRTVQAPPIVRTKTVTKTKTKVKWRTRVVYRVAKSCPIKCPAGYRLHKGECRAVARGSG